MASVRKLRDVAIFRRDYRTALPLLSARLGGLRDEAIEKCRALSPARARFRTQYRSTGRRFIGYVVPKEALTGSGGLPIVSRQTD